MEAGKSQRGGGNGQLAKREFHVLIERDEDGFFVGEVPQLRGCYARGRSLYELMRNIRAAIELCLEDDPAAGQIGPT